jgi:hypothetical protein
MRGHGGTTTDDEGDYSMTVRPADPSASAGKVSRTAIWMDIGTVVTCGSVGAVCRR